MTEQIRVLHVDDDPGLVDVTKEFLEREDERIRVEGANSANEGLDRLADTGVDCVVSDFDMPGMNGIEFLEAVREDHPDLPFVLFTGKGSEEVASRAISAGVTDYLQKGGGTDQYALLANKIRNAVEGYRARRAVEESERRRLRMYERITDGFFAVNADWQYSYVNEEGAGLVGRSKDDLLGERVWDAFPDLEGSPFGEALRTAMETQETTSIEELYPAHDTWYDVTVYPDEEGISIYFRDVSDRKARERAIEELHAAARRIMQTRTETEVAEVVVEAIDDILDMPINGVWIHDERKNVLRPVAWTDRSTAVVGDPPTFSPGEGIAWEVFETGTVRHFDDVSTVPERFEADTDVRSEIIVPIGEYGVITIGSTDSGAFDETDVSLARTVAAHTETALERVEHERDLEEERAFVDQALDTLTDLFYVVGTDGTLRRWNHRVAAVTGYSDAELDGMDAVELFPEDQRERVIEAIGETLSTGEATAEIDVHTKGGERIPYEFTGARLTDADGAPIGLVGVGRDVTDRRELESRLSETADRYRTLVEQNLVGIYAIKDRAFTYVNPRLAEIFGETPEEMIGRSPLEWIVEADRERVRENLRRREDGEIESLRFTVRGRRADGEEIDFEVQGGRTELDGEPVIMGVLREVTEREKLQASLREEKERFERLLDTSPVGITILDPDGSIARANRRAEEVLGLVESEITDRTYDDPEWRIVDEDGEPIPNEDLPFSRVMATGEPVFDYEHGIRWPDGSERWLSVNAAPLTSQGGEIEQVIAVITDVTEQRANERRIERENEQLEQFASVVSHDLRGPLNVAQGRLELGREECDSDHLEVAAGAIDRSITLVDDLLTLAREGNRVGEKETVDLAATVEGCWGNVETAGGTLVAETDGAVQADPERLKQLLENLFRNAAEHGGEDVTVTVGDLADGFYVADDGPGIPAAERDRVFDVGYSTDDAGTGFGLGIVQDIVDAHGWHIDVVNSGAGGARFEITGVERS